MTVPLIITCCWTRAVHIELTPDLSVKSFLPAFRSIISRCGIPENIISDNFKTFKAVEVQNFMRYLRIKWNFILEKSPWWDGFYERMVRSIKNTLKKVVGVSSLDYEQLNTVLVEIENVINSRPLSYMNDENLDENLTPYPLIYGRNIATNKLSLLKIATDGESLRLNCKKINIILKHFVKRFTNEYLSSLHERYTYRTGKKVEDCRLYVGDIVLLREEFVPRMKWRKRKVLKLIRGIDNKVRGAELLVYNKNSEKTSKIKRPLQLIVPLEIDSLGNTKQSRSHCIEPASEYNRPRREAAKNADMKRKLNDV